MPVLVFFDSNHFHLNPMQVPVLIGGHTGMALAGHRIITAIPGLQAAIGEGPPAPLGIRTPQLEQQPRHVAGHLYDASGDSPWMSPSTSVAAATAAESVPWQASAVRCGRKSPSVL